jgi:hypothetical protein
MEDSRAMGDRAGWARAARIWALLAGFAAVAACSVPASADTEAGDGPAPALPTAVNAPGSWSSDEEVRGPLAAIGLAFRTTPSGVFDEMDSLEMFSVSALDGRATWLRLPDLDIGRPAGDAFALSPDGRHIAWARNGPWGQGLRGRWVDGFALMDTTTGEVRELVDPASPSGLLWAGLNEVRFSGDSRYLLTSYALPGNRPRHPRSDQLVAWDVESGTPSVLEEPGDNWLPNLGSAPSGVVWARDKVVRRVDPATSERATVELPAPVVTASWGPGDSSFAYISRTPGGEASNQLHVGPGADPASARPVELPTDAPLSHVLGWQDATHVVVGHHRSWVHVVDVESGEAQRIDLAGAGRPLNAPVLANALWQEPLRTPVEPSGTTDPRAPWRWAALALMLTGAGALVVRHRRSQPPHVPPAR